MYFLMIEGVEQCANVVQIEGVFCFDDPFLIFVIKGIFTYPCRYFIYKQNMGIPFKLMITETVFSH
jgi:hypothetical protein